MQYYQFGYNYVKELMYMQNKHTQQKKKIVIKFSHFKSTKGCIMSDGTTTLILINYKVNLFEIPKIIIKLLQKRNQFYRRNNYGR